MAANVTPEASRSAGLSATVSGVALNPAWPLTLDANGDRVITLADVTSWFFYPGDLCLHWLLTLRKPQAVQLRHHLGLTPDMYHGAFSIVVSFAAWAFALVLLWGIADFLRHFLRSIFFRGRRAVRR